MADGGTTPQQVEDFITHGAKAGTSKLANAQRFIMHILAPLA